MNDFLLNLFTSTDQLRPALMFPNVRDGIVYATDSYSLISIPENELCFKYGSNIDYPSAQVMFEKMQNKALKGVRVKTIDLARELSKARIVIDKHSIKCEECHGSGDVDWEYRDKTGRYHDKESECPVCDGTGTSETESKFARIKFELIERGDSRVGIDIDGLYFHPFQLYRIFMVAAIKRVDDFKIFYNHESYGQTIAYFGNVKVITMLMLRDS